MEHEDEYRALVVRLWPRLVRTARLLGSSLHDAEDHAQAALVQVYLGWDKVISAGDPDAYVYRIMLNTRLTALRRRWHGEIPTSALHDSTLPDPTSEVDLVDALMTALGHLPLKQRQVAVLRYYVDLSEPRIAEVLGIALGTVKSRLHRAQVQLQNDTRLARTLERERS